MKKMTFVIEYEDGKEPSINAGTEILGGRLTAAAFYDYRTALMTPEEGNAVVWSINHEELRSACIKFGADIKEVTRKLDSAL